MFKRAFCGVASKQPLLKADSRKTGSKQERVEQKLHCDGNVFHLHSKFNRIPYRILMIKTPALWGFRLTLIVHENDQKL